MTKSDAPQRLPAFWLLTLSAALTLALLIGLGVWQLQRLAWKEGLIATLAERKSAPPISLDEALKRRQDGADIAFTRVQVDGRFLHPQERYMFRHEAKYGPGVDVYTPLQIADSDTVIWVNRGFAPAAVKPPKERQQGLAEGTQTVVGALRLAGRQATFDPENNVSENLWYWRDLDGMASSVTEMSRSAKWIDVSIDAEAAAPGGWPNGGGSEISLTNRHFSYALTWFGLAGTLIAVYIALVMGRRQRRP
jgi:surfeit locus 1 family protein